MIIAIVHKEVLAVLRDGRLLVPAFSVFAVLTGFFLASSVAEHQQVQQAKQAVGATAKEQWGTQGVKNPHAATHWLVFVGVFTGIWIAISGLFMLLPVSSGVAAAGLLGVWLITTFAVPAGLIRAANGMQPMPSRLTAIVDIRRVQAQTSKQQAELLSAWYRVHPEAAPLKQPPREIAGLPANLELDSKIRPLMYRFDEVRKAHFEFMERWSAFSPGLAAVLTADRLAGVDAPRYAQYIQTVNQFEDRWRAFFVLGIMGKQGMSPSDYEHLPEVKPLPTTETVWTIILRQSLIGILLLLVLITLRNRFGKP